MSNSYDPIDTCPYDPVHRIMRSRMQYHITKCSKNWPCAKKKQCPYDARHVINQIEFNYHISICPQKEAMWHNKLEENKKVEDSGILPIDPSPVLAPAEDVWEEEDNVQSYDPIKHTEDKLITRILIGAPKSQRKKHRLQERLRISRLADDAPRKEKDPATKNKNNYHGTSTIKPNRSKEVSVEAKQIYQPLRCPKELPIDTLKTTKIDAINDSTIVHQMQNTVNQKSNSNKNLVPQTTFSYAAAAKNVLTNQHQQYSSIGSDYNVIESKQCDEKENNNSSFNRNKEDLNLQTTCSYAAAAKIMPTNQHQRYSSIESNYDIIESKKYNVENEHNSSFLNRNKVFDLQESTFSYAAASKNTLADQQYNYIESDYGFIESEKWDTEKEENNHSSLFNRSKDGDLPTTAISYAAATKVAPTIQCRQNCIENINNDSKKDNNSLLTTNRNKDQQRTFNYETATFKYVPVYLHERNSNIKCDSDIVTESIKSETEKENDFSLTNRNKDLDMQTTFNYATDDENIPTIRRPRNSSIESDCDIISESIKYNSEKENCSIFFNRNKEDLDLQTTTFHYATDAEHAPTMRRPRKSSIESDCDIISESINCDIEKDSGSSFFNRNKIDSHIQTAFSYVTAAKKLSTNRRSRKSSIESDCDIITESIKCHTEEEDNNSSFFSRNKVDSDLQATKFNYAAATKYVPHNLQLNKTIISDYDLQSKFSYATTTENVITNQPQRSSSIEFDYDMHTASTAAKNALINRRPRINSTESDISIENKNCFTEKENNLFFNNKIDRNLVKVTRTIKALSIGEDECKMQLESLNRTLESPNTTTNYSSITNNGLNKVNINKPSEKKTSRCTADLHFTNLRQYLQNSK